ncbi:phenylalanine--tRNA ligase subunit beta [Companilactobacillus jidongensis]|uniref:phenylalanine--tRNA ligase subunit beta n=1 Tax=Companilactobacillus jidongensis TaxID=2486006 RepID=UPI000F786656|nr:phenylalanine--tRNA ligase subunit beta [Companilactobacillus jidongensis]
MKISVNWLKEYIPVTHTVEEMANKISLTGIESSPVHNAEGLDKLVVGHITSISQHPDSDHLNITTVDVGEDDDIQIVCGAPNVANDQYVIVALHGAHLPEGKRIKKGKIRGQESNGMICGLDEIGVPTKYVPEAYHKGIYVFPEVVTPGTDALVALGLSDDMVDMDITPNRADTLGMRGAAWEIGATYDEKPKYTAPVIDEAKIVDSNDLAVDIENKELVPDFLVRTLKNVTVGESPLWMQRRLWNQNIQPVNNVIDAANYVMIEFGQPIQAYDLDKLQEKRITVRNAKSGEKFSTELNNQDDDENTNTILNKNDLVVAAGEQILGLAGVAGGISARVTNETKNVVLESAVYDGAAVRKAAQRHDLRGDASNRFEKGVDNGAVSDALVRATQLVDENAHASEISDELVGVGTEAKPTVIKSKISHINHLMGLDLTAEKIMSIFDRLGFTAELDNDDVTVTIPTRRWDMSIEADLVEEVIRIYGYENLKGTLPTGMETAGGYSPKREFSNKLRNILLGQGMNEVINFSLMNKKESEDFNVIDTNYTKLLHPMTEDHEYLRTSLIPGLVNNVAYNQARNNNDISIFEQARIFDRPDGVDRPNEIEYIAGAISGNIALDSWNTQSKQVDFYDVKGIVEELLSFTNIDANFEYRATNKISNLHPGQTAEIIADGQSIGFIGKLHPDYQKEHSIDETFVFELNVDTLFGMEKRNVQAKTAPKYPSISRDLAILVNKDIESGAIVKDIFDNGGKYLIDVNIFDVYQGVNIKANHKSLGYHLVFQNPEDTLTDDTVEKAFDVVKDSLVQKFNVEIR